MRTRRAKVHEAKLADDTADEVRRSHARVIKETQDELDERRVAYGQVTGATGALSDSFNVHSVKRVSTGLYTVRLSIAIDPGARFIHLQSRDGGGARSSDLVPATETPTQFQVYWFEHASSPPAVDDVDFAFRVEAWD